MASLRTHPLEDFHLSDHITAAHLRTDPQVLDKLKLVRRAAEGQWNELIMGGARLAAQNPANQWKHLLGDALINEDMKAAEACCLFWVNLTRSRDSMLQSLWETLQRNNRPDLVRPAIEALHEVGFSVWLQRDGGKSTSSPSDRLGFSDLIEGQNSRLDGPIGVKEWSYLGEDLTRYVNIRADAKTQQVTNEILKDILTTIPDARIWAAPVLLAILTPNLISGAATSANWLPTLAPVIDLLNDREAGYVFRKLADISVLNGSPYSLDQVAERIVNQHGHLSWKDWMGEDTTVIIPSAGLEFSGYGMTRLQLMNESRSFTRICANFHADQMAGLAKTYNRMIGWIGPRNADDDHPIMRRRLTSLLRRPKIQELPLAAMRSALDRLCLTGSSGPDDALEKPITKPMRRM